MTESHPSYDQAYGNPPDNLDEVTAHDRGAPDMTHAKDAFNNWWNEQTRKGDPARRPNLVEDAYIAGFREAISVMRPHLDELQIILNQQPK